MSEEAVNLTFKCKTKKLIESQTAAENFNFAD
jgi:hypothetical protein